MDSLYKTSRPRNPSMDFVFSVRPFWSIKNFLPRPGGGFHGSLDSLLSTWVLRVYRLSRSFAYATRTGDWEEGKWASWANGIAARYKQFIWKRKKKKVTGPDKEREAWAAAVVMKGRELAIHPVSLPKTYHKGEWKTSKFLSVRPTVTFSNWKLGGW